MSVSAEKHLPIVEVKPKLLENFLKEKKEEGYTVIAVEQTSKSITLEKYKFPMKCVILSGNQRRGVHITIKEMSNKDYLLNSYQWLMFA